MHGLVLGGCGSGESRPAERRAADRLALPGRAACLIATARPGDDGRRERIARHRATAPTVPTAPTAPTVCRVPVLSCLQAPPALPEALRAHGAPQRLCWWPTA